MRYVLVALVISLLFPQIAEARLFAKRPPKTIACNAQLTLGVAASSDHKGSRRVRVAIRTAENQIVYRRTVRAPLGDNYEWKKRMRPCGQRLSLRYLFPKGDKLAYTIRVRQGKRPNPPVPEVPEPTPTPTPDPPETAPPTATPEPTPTPISVPVPTPTPTPTPTPVPTPVPTPEPDPEPVASTISLQSGDETQFIRMIWWRGPPEVEGDQRVVGSCSWAPGGGTCINGAPPVKLFRPQHFELIGSELWMDVPQYQDGVKTFDHYPLPVRLVRSGCTFEVEHNRGRGVLEFLSDPPGLEILPHIWTMTGDLCTSFDPLNPTWVADLNAALAEAIPPGPYNRPEYPY